MICVHACVRARERRLFCACELQRAGCVCRLAARLQEIAVRRKLVMPNSLCFTGRRMGDPLEVDGVIVGLAQAACLRLDAVEHLLERRQQEPPLPRPQPQPPLGHCCRRVPALTSRRRSTCAGAAASVLCHARLLSQRGAKFRWNIRVHMFTH